MPGRKKRCPHCGEPIYVRWLPADRGKRLMTEAQVKAIDDAAHAAYQRQKAENTLSLIGVSGEYLDRVIKDTGWELSVAVEAILFAAIAPNSKMTRHQRHCAHWALATKMIEAGDARWREHMEQSIREELTGWEEQGVVLAVRIRKPGAWEPALKMLEMRAAGAGVDEIAKATGYSVITVNRNLETRGLDPRVGPQCDRHAGRIFSFAQALDEMPLPCGETCVCSWSPLLRSNFEPVSQTK